MTAVASNNLNTPQRSKINWTQIVGIAAQIAAYVGIDVPAEQQVQIAIGIAAVQSVVTWVWRTWYTG